MIFISLKIIILKTFFLKSLIYLTSTRHFSFGCYIFVQKKENRTLINKKMYYNKVKRGFKKMEEIAL